jgi:membrane-bound metal-dependent hydrolase YbcI (DUF457 family)
MAGAAYATLGEYVWHQRPAVLAAGTAIACGAGVLPDLDTVGSSVARSFGWITEAMAYVVRAISGGHREDTHTGCGDVLCAAIAVAAIALEAVRFRAHLGPVHRELSAGRLILGAYLALLFGAGMKALRILHRSDLRREAVAVAGAAAMAWSGFDTGGIAWAILLGTFVHCCGDGLTKHGVPWLAPFSKHILHLLPKRWRISTGHFTERWVIAPAMVLALAFLAFNAVRLSMLPGVRAL